MTLPIGRRLSHYEIVATLGAGGMGEVYRARDVRLDRSVAIKVLPDRIASDADMRARFEREARAVSSLNHPNICTLFDVGSDGGVDFLVMELVDGETLADRLKKGPLSLDQALRIAIEIASALEAAHRQGVVHRDLKPGNVMLTKSGAKLLDFGLAKRRAKNETRDSARSADTPLTTTGAIVGTPQYMAPEQLHGKDADARSDLFAFGAVVYEMLTGRRAFTGESPASVMAAILERDPAPIAELAPITPPALDRAVRQCLAKDPDERWQSAGDLRRELEWITSSRAHASPAEQGGGAARARVAWSIAALATLIAIGMGALAWKRGLPPAPRSVRLAIARPLSAPFEYFDNTVVSPDGRRVAFVGYVEGGKQTLWVRTLDSDEPRPLAGTEGANQPFWSPDSRALGYFANAKLMRISADGGPPQALCDIAYPYGGTWSANGTIVFGGGIAHSLMRVADTGGTPVAVTRLAPHDEAHRWPAFLPDGVHVAYLADSSSTERHILRVAALESGESTDVLQAVSNVAYAPPGFLLYVRGGALVAHAFDPDRLRVTGEPRTIGEHVVQCADNHRFDFSVSSNGTLTFRSASPMSRMTWLDRGGLAIGNFGQPESFSRAALSPAADRIAFGRIDCDGRALDLWTMDVGRGVSSRLTFDRFAGSDPVWSPDGEHVAFSVLRPDGGDLVVASVNSPREPRVLRSSTTSASWAQCWSPDGRELVFVSDDIEGEQDLWVLPLDEPAAARRLIATPSSVEDDAKLSPDGRWIAYTTDESGRTEVYVQAYPPGGKRWQISTATGRRPRWRGDGRELFYVSNENAVMSVAVKPEPEFIVEAPRKLFSMRGGDMCDVTSDGQRFLATVPIQDSVDAPLTVVLDWTAALKSDE